ncbi:MAG: LysM peptidoglycan-binding domain-containing protein [Phycisphaerae bacterium]|jgi:nucleoid-associated protein YgaU
MRRNATYLAATLAIAFGSILTGCKSTTKKDTTWNPTYDLGESYADASTETAYEPETYPTYGETTADETTYEPETTYDPPATATPTTTLTASAGPRYHTVVKNDTLYGLARKYYGDHHRWKDIYEANRTTIGNPNRILVGQRLLIP